MAAAVSCQQKITPKAKQTSMTVIKAVMLVLLLSAFRSIIIQLLVFAVFVVVFIFGDDLKDCK